MGKMHADERAIDRSLVARLLAGQFPQWANLPLTPIPSAGTDNAIYRLGDRLAVRLPRIEGAIGQISKEHVWLPRLAPHLPLAIPIPLAMGKPCQDYPWPWSVYRWQIGESAQSQPLTDQGQAARDLARFIAALQRIDPAAWSPVSPPTPLVACRFPPAMFPRVPPLPSFPAWLTPMPRRRCGMQPSKRLRGRVYRCGLTETCYRGICWFKGVGLVPSSTLECWAWAIPHATCSSRGACFPDIREKSSARSSRSMRQCGSEDEAGR